MSGAPHWAPRWPALTAEFAVAEGEAGVRLARALLASPPRLAQLRGLVSGQLLAVTGAELPWVDGVEYFGRDGACPWLLVPSTRATELPTAWLERRFREQRPDAGWPCLLLPPGATRSEQRLLPVGGATQLDPAKLAAWCERD